MSSVCQNFDEFYKKLQHDRYLFLSNELSLLSKQDFEAIEKLIECVPFEDVIDGDAGDKHKLQVARFRRDIETPTDLHEVSYDLMKIINSEKLQQFYREITGFKDVCIRRAQANILHEGNFVGVHIDGEGDPKYQGTHKDYKYAIVLHFKMTYSGGDTIMHTKDGVIQLPLGEYSMNITAGEVPHAIDVVTSGIRKTIVYFLSDNFGVSKK